MYPPCHILRRCEGLKNGFQEKNQALPEGEAWQKLSCQPTSTLFFTSFGVFLNEADCAEMPCKTSPLLPF